VPDLADFGNSLDGALFSPDSPGYAIHRPVNLAYSLWEVRPAWVPRTVDEPFVAAPTESGWQLAVGNARATRTGSALTETAN